MKKIKEILLSNKIFIIPYFIVFTTTIIILIIYKKVDIHLFINTYHSSFFDIFFKYWTHLGDGFFSVIVIVFFLFVRYKWAIIITLSSLFTAVITQFLKRVIFTESYRPDFFFRYIYKYKLYFIEGVEPGAFNSFPSGHSALGFSIFFLFAIITKNNYLKFLFFVCAVLIAFSRIYLSWHFTADVIGGSIIGITITLFSFYFISKSTKTWLDKSLINK